MRHTEREELPTNVRENQVIGNNFQFDNNQILHQCNSENVSPAAILESDLDLDQVDVINYNDMCTGKPIRSLGAKQALACIELINNRCLEALNGKK